MGGARRELSIAPGTRVDLTSVRVQGRTVEARIDELLGAGGTALVYGGELADGTHIVVKTPRWEGVVDPGFAVEVELFKKFAHRNIVHCIGIGEHGGQHLLCFRRAYENPLLLMTKGSVDEGMRRDKRALYPSLPIDAAIDLGYELLNALEHLESKGYVHHDVKLANLLIDIAPKERPLQGNEVFGRVVRRDYRGVLIDFGATRSREYLQAYNEGKAPPGLTPQVTPFYAPPEALVEARRPDGTLGVSFDTSIDVYAAALVLYAMITGHPPYSHLRAAVDPRDMESVIGVKSAERRGEIEAVSQEVIQRVVLEDTRFVGGDRSAWDMALFRFLGQRLSPDPTKRGTTAQMKRDFEQLMLIKTARDDAGPREGGSRVFLPFTQELVKVGSGGEHPLLRAARLYGVDAKESAPANKSGEWRAQPGGEEKPGGLGWLDSASDAPPRRGVAPSSAEPGTNPRGTRRHRPADLKAASEARAAAAASEGRAAAAADAQAQARAAAEREARARERASWNDTRADSRASWNETRADSSTDARRPSSSSGAWPIKPPTPPRSDRPGEKPPPLVERPPTPQRTDRPPLRPAGGERPAAPPPRPPSGIGMVQTQARQVMPAPGGADPCSRPPPRPERAGMPHCLVSAVLDEPLLLVRERRTVLGRDGAADVRIKSDLVSRRHAEVAWGAAGFTLHDLGSVNGTLVNGVRIGGPCLLHGDDRISIAGFELVVRVVAPGDAPEQPTEGGGTTRLLRPEVAKALVKDALVGELGPLGLRDVVDLLEWKKHSGTLTVTPIQGGPGRLFVKNGVIIHSETKSGKKGLEAAMLLLRVTAGRFSFAPGKPRCPATITCGNEDLWARAAARADG